MSNEIRVDQRKLMAFWDKVLHEGNTGEQITKILDSDIFKNIE